MSSLPAYAPLLSSNRSGSFNNAPGLRNSSPSSITTVVPQQNENVGPAYTNPLEHNASDDYFSVDRNVFYRPNRDVALGDVASAPMGTFDWGIVPENFTDDDRKHYEMAELQAAAILERHPCGEQMKALLNASRSLPVGIYQNTESKMSGSKGNFRRALEVASQAGGSGGASHSLLYSKGGPERRINTAQMKWGPVKFSDMGTVALGAKITREIIELRRAFSKRDAIVTFPDHVTPEALAFAASRFGPNWEMFDIQKHADPDSEIMKVYMEKGTTAASKKASLHGSESALVTYTKEGNPVWHRPPGEKALMTSAFRVAEHEDEPLIGPNGESSNNIDNGDNNLAESNNLPLPAMPERPKGWPKDGPGFPPPSSQEGLRLKRFRLEDRVPAYKAVVDQDSAKQQSDGPPQVQVGVAHLRDLHAFDKDKKSKNRLPVWRALKTAGKKYDEDELEYMKNNRGDENDRGDFSEFEPNSPNSNNHNNNGGASSSPQNSKKINGNAFAGGVKGFEQRSAPRSNRDLYGPTSPHRLHSRIMTPNPKPEEGTYNQPLLLRAARITEENQQTLAAVEKKRDNRGRIVDDGNKEEKIGETAIANSRSLGLLLAPPPVPFSDVRRSHTAPMLPFMAVSGVPKFDAITATSEQSTAWKDLLAQI